MDKGRRPIPPWVFTARNGTPYGQRLVEKDFREVCKRAKLSDHLTPHSMRHTFACFHIGQGAARGGSSSRWGHGLSDTTLDRYTKWGHLEDHAAADALWALVGGEVAAKVP